MAHIIQAPPCPFTGPPVTVARAISPNGRYVVGYHHQCDPIYDEAFVYDTTTGEFFKIPRPAGVYDSAAADVNDAGMVAGTYWDQNEFGGQRGFIYDFINRQYIVELQPLPGAAWCSINAINSSGTVCGTRSIGSRDDPVNPQTAYIWSSGNGYSDLGVINGANTLGYDLNNENQVALIGRDQQGEDAGFIWDGESVTSIGVVPGGISSFCTAINTYGVVGGSGVFFVNGSPDYHSQPFTWFDGKYTLIPHLSGTIRGGVGDVNDAGDAVGLMANLNSQWRPYVWQGGSTRDLNELISANTKVNLFRGLAINNLGQIIADGTTQVGNHIGVMLQPIDPLLGDTNCDSIVNVDDLLAVIRAWGKCAGCWEDLNADGSVNITDLILVIEHWD